MAAVAPPLLPGRASPAVRGAAKSMFPDGSPDLQRQLPRFVIGKVDCRHSPASFMPSLFMLTARAH